MIFKPSLLQILDTGEFLSHRSIDRSSVVGRHSFVDRKTPESRQILLPALLPAPSKHRARKCLSPCPHSFINRQLRQRPWVTYVLGLILLYAALLLTPQPLHAQTDSVAGRVNKSGPSATNVAIVEAQLTNTQTIHQKRQLHQKQ